MLDMTDLNEQRSGALLAVYRYLGKHVKVGVGYNFTDFSDDLTDLSLRPPGCVHQHGRDNVTWSRLATRSNSNSLTANSLAS